MKHCEISKQKVDQMATMKKEVHECIKKMAFQAKIAKLKLHEYSIQEFCELFSLSEPQLKWLMNGGKISTAFKIYYESYEIEGMKHRCKFMQIESVKDNKIQIICIVT